MRLWNMKEEIKNSEMEYLRKKSRFQIERDLIQSFSKQELADFIEPLYTRYNALWKSLQKRYDDITSQCPYLWELALFTIERLIFHIGEQWEEYQYIKKTLETVDFHLRKEDIQEKYWERFKEIDIHTIPIEDVIWRYTQLPKNLNRNMRCPFSGHNDKTASFRIYTKTNSWYCYWEWIWGNAINFISHMENCSTKEAFKIFINLYS